LNRSDARKILGDDPHKTYRQLSKIHHPDAGGDSEMFHKLRDAYEALTKEEPSAEYDLLAQLFLQELEIPNVFLVLDKMEVTHHETINAIPKKRLKLEGAKPKAKGFLVQVLESAINNLEEEERAARNSIAEIKKARILLQNLYT
jgi:curved DNA-binding protein CbpA